MARMKRYDLRLTSEQEATIRQAAEAEGTDLDTFVVTTTVAHAQDVLASRRRFELDDTVWTNFLSTLKRPPTPKPRLQRLFAAPATWDSQ